MNRQTEQRLAEAALLLADTVGDEFDLSDVRYGLTASCVELLDVDTAGLLLADEQDRLHTVASSDDGTRLLELFQLQQDEGPCVDRYRAAAPVTCTNLDDADERWPNFTPRARAEGVHSVHAMPLGVRKHSTSTDHQGQVRRPNLSLLTSGSARRAVAAALDDATISPDNASGLSRSA